jgi:hypothetical protein
MKRHPEALGSMVGRGLQRLTCVMGPSVLALVVTTSVLACVAVGSAAYSHGGTQAVSLTANSPVWSLTGAPATVSSEVRYLVNWIAATSDNASFEFVVIDKKLATAHVFDAQHRLLASSPVLVGSALGDDAVQDIGTRPLALVQSHERTTPAGRFVAELGTNVQGESVVWVDYAAAVSMHSVRLSNANERRLERLASAEPTDHRISYGCINFPDAFFKAEVLPRFKHQNALVYVLPDQKPVDSVFRSFAADSSLSRASAHAQQIVE